MAHQMTGIMLGVWLCVMTVLPAWAQEDFHPMLSQAIEHHNHALQGKKNHTKPAIALLKEVLQADPDDAVARVYLGSVYTLTARDSTEVVDKIRFSNRGIRYLNEAVAADPQNFHVRIVSFNVNKSLPKMFSTRSKAEQDAIVLDRLYSRNPTAKSAKEMVEVYDYLVRVGKKHNSQDEVKQWQNKKQQAQQAAQTDR